MMDEMDQLRVGCRAQTPSGIRTSLALEKASNLWTAIVFKLHAAEFEAGPVDMRIPSPLRTPNGERRTVLGWLHIIALFLLLPALASADFRVTLPKRTKPTKVQQLNRDGVKAIQKHDYDEAKKLFYQAYLLDPDDPFTLNNLGYMAELEGDMDRASRFYDLAKQQNSDAVIDRADSKKAEGRTVAQVAGHADQSNMQVNQLNIRALELLKQERAPEADTVLTRSLALDPKNPFTLNNMGFAKEKEGELEAALNYYNQAAALGSREPIIVTVHRDWRGRPISQVAADNAEKVHMLIRQEQGADKLAKVQRLNLQGVSALNRNDRRAARGYFEQAYKLDPTDAFTLNNMGFVAEMDGDRETAQFYYAKAQEADHSSRIVSASNRAEAEGHRLSSVADTSQTEVESKLQSAIQERRAKGAGPALKRRGAPAEQPQAPQQQDQNQWKQQPPQNQDQLPEQKQPKQSPPTEQPQDEAAPR
jgi:Flp pilus assembly protein TadD